MGTGENVIIACMFLRSACVLTLVLGAAVSAGAMPFQSPVVIDDDVRVFTIVTALNVSGFDVELGPQYHPARAEIRKVADTLDPDLLRRMKEFYNSHKGGAPDSEQLAKYISLAVVLTDPPGLKPLARKGFRMMHVPFLALFPCFRSFTRRQASPGCGRESVLITNRKWIASVPRYGKRSFEPIRICAFPRAVPSRR
jgi:hypothetical protein